MPLRFQPIPLGRLPEAFSHPDWLFETKWDGFRALLHSDKEGVRLVSRNGNVFKSFPGLCKGLGATANFAFGLWCPMKANGFSIATTWKRMGWGYSGLPANTIWRASWPNTNIRHTCPSVCGGSAIKHDLSILMVIMFLQHPTISSASA